ncbi:hypothetical protein [Saccharibacillus endophyticus]|uniref:Lipoprotein n=1 Tax=Saccharibacillus endophyticus TaxID=2060666 RepID=A0ABQ1ZXU6_9BACL|nr:hypothetical protein [Saccharibacillus endophyticus]GGH80645.1 hypothetical protein GCM10007362_29280 [Saccharibacillus endophyticus]
MKPYNRAASILGVLLLSTALAACGSESDSASQSEPNTSTAATDKANIEEPATATPDEEAAADQESGEEAAADSTDAATDDQAANETDKPSDSAADDAAATDDASSATATIDQDDPADASKQGKKGAGADRPKTENFEIATADSTDSVTGKLQEGYGYAFYAMEGLEFDAETNRLSMTSNPDYYAIITPLEKGYALATLRNEAKTALKAYGTPVELKGDKAPAALSASRLFLSAENEAGTGQFALWETPAKGYDIKINIPAGADAETFAPLVYGSLSTLAD